MQQVLSQEFIARERRKVVQEAIDGLNRVQRERRLNPTEQAALRALTALHSRTASTRGAIITHESMMRPVAVAHRAMEGVSCAIW